MKPNLGPLQVTFESNLKWKTQIGFNEPGPPAGSPPPQGANATTMNEPLLLHSNLSCWLWGGELTYGKWGV